MHNGYNNKKMHRGFSNPVRHLATILEKNRNEHVKQKTFGTYYQILK